MYRSTRAFGAALIAVVLTAATPLAAGARDDSYVYQSNPPAPLRDATTYVVVGTRTADGCRFEYPSLSLRDGETTRVQRDVGIDQGRCRKLVEEGVPTQDEEVPGADSSITETIGHREAKGSSVTAAAVGHSGFTKIWWVDQPGYMVNQDATYISWIDGGSCVTQGNASGDWQWRSGSGWQIVSYGGTDNLTCARYRGETWSTFKNGVFCLFAPTVYTYYYFVRAYGWATGTAFTGSWSSNSVDECLPLYERHQVSQTG